jgi:methylmalonyl-CoA carboxyltransferase small subunit
VKLKITIDNKTYEVEVEAAEPDRPAGPSGYVMQPAAVRVPAAPPQVAPPSTGGPVADESKVCRSPISGIVVRVVAQEGQHIQTGDIILVLEAMKMETNITAPISGTIRTITVDPGATVQGGQVLAEFD